MDDERSEGSAELVGRVVADRYRIGDVVSAGANTLICSAVVIATDRPVTFKIVQPELAHTEEFRREFRRRAEVAMVLGHPNIAAVLDFGDLDFDGESTVFWVVEHLGGGSLRDLFDRGRLLQPSQALVVGLEACRALDAAHQRGIVHTELTPSKLVFGADRRLRIIDFGIAELLGRAAWSEPATVATHVARYASPEQALGLGVEPKTDIYALALCLLEAVEGAVPFAAESTVATLTARVGKLMPVSADLGSLAAVIERAGRPDADDRFTAAELGRALVQAAENLPRPEPIPIVAATIFDPAEMRQPSDPTGGVTRPAESPVLDAMIDDASPIAAPLGDIDESPIPAHEGDGLVILPDESVGDDDQAAGDAPAPVVPIAPAPEHAIPTPDPTIPIPATVPATVPATAAATVPTPVTEQMPITTAAPTSLNSALYDEERPRRRTGVMAAVGLLVLAGLAAVAFAAFYLMRTKSYEVPALSGVDEAIALNEISGNDWTVSIERERSDDEPDVGQVIRTFPLAGAVLEEGAEFTLFVSEGPLFRVLPDVVGQTTEAATATLADLELQSFVDAEEFDEVAAPGVVLSWKVLGAEASVAGDEVLPGTNIALAVSKGPAPRAVPEVTGLTLEDAQATAAGVQLNVVAGEDAFSDDVPAGIIISQDTAAGVELARDSTFTVIRSKGPDLIALPPLEGLTYTAAQQALLDAGFTIGSLLGTTEGTFQSISIVAEPVGDLYRRGTSVDLIFL